MHRAVVRVVRGEHHADLAPRLDGVGFGDTVECLGQLLELLQPFDVGVQALAPGAGPGGADGVRHGDDDVVDGVHLQRVVVGGDGADHLGPLPEAPRQVRPDSGMGPLDLMVDGLAEVVQQAGPPRQFLVQPQLCGDGPGYVSHLEAVGERVLSVAEAELELAQGTNQLRVHVLDPHLQDGGLPRR